MGAFLVTYVEGMAGAGRLLASGGGAGDSDGGGDGGDGVPGQAQGELLTSAFWVSFTAGRFVNGAASARFRPACAGPSPSCLGRRTQQLCPLRECAQGSPASALPTSSPSLAAPLRPTPRPPRVILLAELALLNTSILLVVLAPRSAGALWVGVLGCGLVRGRCGARAPAHSPRRAVSSPPQRLGQALTLTTADEHPFSAPCCRRPPPGALWVLRRRGRAGAVARWPHRADGGRLRRRGARRRAALPPRARAPGPIGSRCALTALPGFRGVDCPAGGVACVRRPAGGDHEDHRGGFVRCVRGRRGNEREAHRRQGPLRALDACARCRLVFWWCRWW